MSLIYDSPSGMSAEEKKRLAEQRRKQQQQQQKQQQEQQSNQAWQDEISAVGKANARASTAPSDYPVPSLDELSQKRNSMIAKKYTQDQEADAIRQRAAARPVNPEQERVDELVRSIANEPERNAAIYDAHEAEQKRVALAKSFISGAKDMNLARSVNADLESGNDPLGINKPKQEVAVNPRAEAEGSAGIYPEKITDVPFENVTSDGQIMAAIKQDPTTAQEDQVSKEQLIRARELKAELDQMSGFKNGIEEGATGRIFDPATRGFRDTDAATAVGVGIQHRLREKQAERDAQAAEKGSAFFDKLNRDRYAKAPTKEEREHNRRLELLQEQGASAERIAQIQAGARKYTADVSERIATDKNLTDTNVAELLDSTKRLGLSNAKASDALRYALGMAEIGSKEMIAKFGRETAMMIEGAKVVREMNADGIKMSMNQGQAVAKLRMEAIDGTAEKRIKSIGQNVADRLGNSAPKGWDKVIQEGYGNQEFAGMVDQVIKKVVESGKSVGEPGQVYLTAYELLAKKMANDETA